MRTATAAAAASQRRVLSHEAPFVEICCSTTSPPQSVTLDDDNLAYTQEVVLCDSSDALAHTLTGSHSSSPLGCCNGRSS